MLNTMRKFATGWVVKVLLGLLIVSFAVWGIGDVLRAPQVGAAVAQVAGSEVEERECCASSTSATGSSSSAPAAPPG
jgi:peptidyl-prolyl cis-trans isomerase D